MEENGFTRRKIGFQEVVLTGLTRLTGLGRGGAKRKAGKWKVETDMVAGLQTEHETTDYKTTGRRGRGRRSSSSCRCRFPVFLDPLHRFADPRNWLFGLRQGHLKPHIRLNKILDC